MSPIERSFFARVHRKTGVLTPELATAILNAFRAIAANLSEAEVARLIASGAVDQIVTRILADEVLARAFRPVQRRLRTTLDHAVTFHAKDVPTPKATGKLTVAFDVLDPKVIDAIRSLETKVITDRFGETRETVRAFLENGLRDGVNPRTLARDLRSTVGLSPAQELAVRNYRAELEAGRTGAATARQLHDARFSVTNLTPEKIDRMVTVYRKNMIAFHAETVARTGTLDAFKRGQALAWQQAIDDGIVDGGRLRRTWVTVGDDRVRDEHVTMQGETVGFDQQFSNGEYTPGESTYNCRCLARVFQSRAA